MPDLSLVIVAQNEERTIGKVLHAARDIVNEIILVDSGSTDGTIDVATAGGARVVHQDWLGYAAQKNFALDLATGEWLLSLDADEIMTPQLVNEIKEILSDPASAEYDGFKIPRLLFIGDKPVAHGGFFPDAQLRLIRRGAGRFNDRLVHEAIKVNGKTRTLKHHMNHYSYVDVQAFELAMDKYAHLHAAEFLKRPNEKKDSARLKDVLYPSWIFLYRYLFRAGFLDGPLGFALCWKYSVYVARKIRYLREARAKALK